MNLDRQLALLSRAYPPRIRVQRGPEIASTARDLLSEEVSMVPLAMALDIVLGGLRTHWRTRPPFGQWLRFHLQMRIAERWHPWMLDRLAGRFYRIRATIVRTSTVVAIQAASIYFLPGPWPPVSINLVLPYIMAFSILGWMVAPRWRRLVLRKNGRLSDGSPDLRWQWRWFATTGILPNLRLAPLVLAVSVPAALCSITVAFAVTHQHPRRIVLPHGVVAAPPAPSDVVAQLVTAARIGLVTGALVLALAAFCFWRLSRTPGASARVASHVWLVRLTAIGSTCLGIYLTALEFIAGLSYEWAVITAFAGPLGIAGIAAALALLRAEKQRGRWISLWDVFPRLAPRCKESPMTVESLPTHPQTMSVS